MATTKFSNSGGKIDSNITVRSSSVSDNFWANFVKLFKCWLMLPPSPLLNLPIVFTMSLFAVALLGCMNPQDEPKHLLMFDNFI